jgi:hypothetical protein
MFPKNPSPFHRAFCLVFYSRGIKHGKVMVGQQVHMSGLKGLPLTHVRIMNDKTVMKYWCVHLSELVCSSTDLNVSLIDTSLNECNCSIYAKLLFKFIVLFKIVCTINFYSTSYSSDPATVLFLFSLFFSQDPWWLAKPKMSAGGLRLSDVKSYSVLIIFIANLL